MEQLDFIAETGGERLDKYLSECIDDMTRSAVVNLIDSGKCTVNGKPAAKNLRLKENDEIALVIPDAVDVDIKAEDIPLDIVYEDNDLLVVNKPKGMVVHPAPSHYTGTLVNALMYHCKDSLSGINGEIRPGIVHRIDKDTSGLLIVAKNDNAHKFLARQIKEHSFTREYEAIVNGCIKENGTVDLPIGRHKTDRKKMAVTDVNSRNAVTHYEVIENFENTTHIKCILETGRTHQIRVHLSYIGHSVLGDEVYGNGKPKWLNGQCLHARKIGFVHPTTNEYMEFQSELPDYFRKMLSQLKKTDKE